MPGTVLSDLHAPLSPISTSLLKAEGFLQLEAEGEVGEVQSPRRTGPAVAGLKLLVAGWGGEEHVTRKVGTPQQQRVAPS